MNKKDLIIVCLIITLIISLCVNLYLYDVVVDFRSRIIMYDAILEWYKTSYEGLLNIVMKLI